MTLTAAIGAGSNIATKAIELGKWTHSGAPALQLDSGLPTPAPKRL